MRRQQLTETQIAELFDPPTDQRELVRHYTLSGADLAMIRRYRGEYNRLGQALMLCYLRYPGRPLKAGERPPKRRCSHLSQSRSMFFPMRSTSISLAERNRQRHAVEMQDRLKLPSLRYAFHDRTDKLAAAACDRRRSACSSRRHCEESPTTADRRAVAQHTRAPLHQRSLPGAARGPASTDRRVVRRSAPSPG